MATEAARGASRTDGEGATAGRAGSSDLVDRFQADWLAVRPDLDVAPMGVIGRLLRAAPLILAASETYLRPLDLTRAEFDIVSALCRSARPLSHGELTSLLLFTGPATTKRLRRLEAGGWIQRTANPADGRGVLLQPTPDGARRFGALLPGYLALEASLIDHLAARDREDLTVLLRRLLSRWEAARR